MEISYVEEIKRKLIHLSSLWMVAATLLLAQKQWIVCLIFAALLLLTLVLEHDYANGGKYLGRLYGKLFKKMLRNEVKPGQWIVSGGAPVLAAGLMMNVLFAPVIAASGLAVMLTGDAFAALIGRKFGKHKFFNGKSVEGCAAFLITDWLIVIGAFYITGFSWIILVCGLIGVVIAMIAELFNEELHLDDNFSIPLLVGGMFWIGLLLAA